MATKNQHHKKLSRTAAEHVVADELMTLSEKFLACRDLRHTWKIEDNFHERDDFDLRGTHAKQAVSRVLRCSTCQTTRTDTYLLIQTGPNSVPRLEKWSSLYGYPKGYQMKQGHVPRDLAVSQLVRYETLRRVLNVTAVAS